MTRPFSTTIHSGAAPDLNKLYLIRTWGDTDPPEAAAAILLDYPACSAMVALRAGTARKLDQGIERDPVLDDPAHALVFGPKTRSIKSKLAKASVWEVPPPELFS